MVKLPQPTPTGKQLFVARHELTWAEYIPAVLENGCPLPTLPRGIRYPSNLKALADNYPVNHVPPAQFSCYLNWITKKTGHLYRLPTGEEWEFAARAGAKGRFPWGEKPGFGNTAVYSWFNPPEATRKDSQTGDPRVEIGKDRTLFPVELFAPNAWGLFDVIGNVSEYTSDTRPGSPVCVRRKGPDFCVSYIVRGGAFSSIGRTVGMGLTGADDNYFELKDSRWAGAAQTPGYRIVREVAND